jgi:hypothetical protein
VDKEVSIPTVNDKRIAAHIPVIDNSKRGDRHLLARRLRARRHLHLPDKTLTTTRKVVTHQGEQVLDCDVRPFNMRGCPKEPACKILRSIYEDACDVAHLLAGTEVFERSRHDRKRVEMLCPSTASEFLRIGPSVARTTCQAVCAAVSRHYARRLLQQIGHRPEFAAAPSSAWLRSQRVRGSKKFATESNNEHRTKPIAVVIQWLGKLECQKWAGCGSREGTFISKKNFVLPALSQYSWQYSI